MINGIVGRKKGMTQVYAEDGAILPVTVIEVALLLPTTWKSASGGSKGAPPASFTVTVSVTVSSVDRLVRSTSAVTAACAWAETAVSSSQARSSSR